MYCSTCGNTVPAEADLCASCAVRPDSTEASPFTSRVLAAAGDASVVLRLLVRDPVAGTGVAYTMLGRRRALDAGIALAVLVDLAAVIAVRVGAQKVLGWLAPFVAGDSFLSGLLKAMLLTAIPLVALMLILAAVRRMFQATLELESVVLAGAGASVPAALVLLASAVLGAASLEIIAVLTLFAMCYTVLVLYGACRDVLGLSSERAAAAVPLVIVAAAWLSKLVLATLA